MKIVVANPPNFEKVAKAFNLEGHDIIYAWGDTIYNPTGMSIPAFLIAHEEVHGARQGTDVEGWWDRYIHDIEFRYQEELWAHAKEYQVRSRGVKDRNLKSRLLMDSANRLCSPLYGKLTTVQKAMKEIRAIYS